MISVCIATHNGDRFIKDQLNSILCQLAPDDEVVISDDGSTDKTLDIIRSFGDSRIKLFTFLQTAKGKVSHFYVCKNFENALKHAKGDYIFLADQDDWWMPNKVEKCMEVMKTHTLVVHRAEICDGELNPSGRLMYKDEFVFRNYLALRVGKYYGCTIAFRKDLLKWILPFPNELVLHDQWIGCLAELTGSVYYEHEILMKYRVHGNNTSGGGSNHSRWFQIKYRLYLFAHLMARRYIHM